MHGSESNTMHNRKPSSLRKQSTNEANPLEGSELEIHKDLTKPLSLQWHCTLPTEAEITTARYYTESTYHCVTEWEEETRNHLSVGFQLL